MVLNKIDNIIVEFPHVGKLGKEHTVIPPQAVVVLGQSGDGADADADDVVVGGGGGERRRGGVARPVGKLVVGVGGGDAEAGEESSGAGTVGDLGVGGFTSVDLAE